MKRIELRQDATFQLTARELQMLHEELRRNYLKGQLGTAAEGVTETLQEIMEQLRETLEKMGLYD